MGVLKSVWLGLGAEAQAGQGPPLSSSWQMWESPGKDQPRASSSVQRYPEKIWLPGSQHRSWIKPRPRYSYSL